MNAKNLFKLYFIFFGLSFAFANHALATQGLYMNGQWDKACNTCWPNPRTDKNNHCKPTDCAIQGYYHCKPQNPSLAIDDDARLVSLIKAGDCHYVSNMSFNAGEAQYIKNTQFCTQVLDKMAGRFNPPANPDYAKKFKVDFYFTQFKASILGLAYSQLQLAMDYDKGIGTKQNRNKATLLYNQAAFRAIPFAQYAMGARYAYGIDMPKDKDKAIMWLNKALNSRPLTMADKKAQSLVRPCAIRLIERLTLN